MRAAGGQHAADVPGAGRLSRRRHAVYANYQFSRWLPRRRSSPASTASGGTSWRRCSGRRRRPRIWFHARPGRRGRGRRVAARTRDARPSITSGAGLLTVKAEGVRHRYRRLQAPQDIEALAGGLHQRTLERETRNRPAASGAWTWPDTTAARCRIWASISANRWPSRAATARGAWTVASRRTCCRGRSR